MKTLIFQHRKWYAVLLFMLTISIGNAWGATYTYTPTGSYSTSGGESTSNSISWTYSSATYISLNGSKIQVGSKNNPQTTDWTIQTAVSNFGSSKKVTSISLTAYTTVTSATYDISAGGSSVKSGSLTTSSNTYTASDLNVTSGDIVITMTGSSTSKAMYLSSITVVYEDAAATPTLTASPTSLSWGTGVLQGSTPSTKTVSISGSNLTSGNLTISASGGYSVSPTSVAVNGTLSATTLTITPPSTSTTGAKNGTLTISGGGLASDITVSLSMTVVTAYSVSWYVNGSPYSTGSPTTLVASGGTIETFPTAPASCDAEKEFVGWSATNIGSTPTDTKPTFVSSQTTISSAQTYYAVFAAKTANKYVLGSKTDLIDDRKVLVVYPAATAYAMSNTASGTKLSGVGVTISSSTITSSDTTIIWTVKPQADGNYQFKSGSNYLYATDNNKLYCGSTTDSWSVTANSSHYILQSAKCSKNLEYYSGFTVYNTGTTDAYQMDFYIPEYKNYVTTCCENLGQINGPLK